MIRQSLAWQGKGLESSGQLMSILCGEKGRKKKNFPMDWGEASEMFGLTGNVNEWGGGQDFLKVFLIKSVNHCHKTQHRKIDTQTFS